MCVYVFYICNMIFRHFTLQKMRFLNFFFFLNVAKEYYHWILMFLISFLVMSSICFSNTKMDVWFFDIGRYVVLNISHSLFRNKRFNSKIYQNYFTRSIHKYNPPIFEEWVIQYSFMNIFYISNVKKWGFFFSLG